MNNDNDLNLHLICMTKSRAGFASVLYITKVFNFEVVV